MKCSNLLFLSFFVFFYETLTVSDICAQTEVKLVPGNPSNAVANLNNPNNYLVVHSGFVPSYNKARGGANWVVWHLATSDIADTERTNAFAPDTSLPRDWWIKPPDFVLKGYDRRGHLCPMPGIPSGVHHQ